MDIENGDDERREEGKKRGKEEGEKTTLQSPNVGNDLDVDKQLGTNINKGLDININSSADVSNRRDSNPGQAQSVQIQLLDEKIQTKLGMGRQISLDLDSQLLDIDIDQRGNLDNNRMGILLEAGLVGLGADLEDDRADMGINIGKHDGLEIEVDTGLDVGVDVGLGTELKILDVHIGFDKTQDLGLGVQFDDDVGAGGDFEVDTSIDEDLSFGLDKDLDDGVDQAWGGGRATGAALEEVDGALVVGERGESLGRGGEEGEGHDGRNERADSHFWSWGWLELVWE